jgi:hypothetical protein
MFQKDSEDADVSIPDIVSLPGSSTSATGGEVCDEFIPSSIRLLRRLQRSRTMQLLEQRLPPTPALNQSDTRTLHSNVFGG